MNHSNVIGLNKSLPWHYSEDLRRFKKVTMDSSIIMGRLTWESMGSKPLPGRRNIVISRMGIDGTEHYPSIEEALSWCRDQRTWIIGGGQIYSAAFPYLTKLDITLVPDIIDDDNVIRFPDINPGVWEASEPVQLGDNGLVNLIYTRRSGHPPVALDAIRS